MAEYIKRVDAINSMWKALYSYEDRTEEQFQNDPDLDLGDWALHRIFVQRVHAEGIKKIIGIPAADVAPVRHGKWIIKDKHIYQCNRCGNYLDIRGLNGGRGDANYCPNCGAKADGGGDHE